MPGDSCLCPAKDGAMKRTTEGQWAHIACALLVPEVFFRDPDGRDGIDCSRVPAHRFTKECYICESSNGCALECSQPKCIRGFHVSCGLEGGLCIEYQEEKSGAIVGRLLQGAHRAMGEATTDRQVQDSGKRAGMVRKRKKNDPNGFGPFQDLQIGFLAYFNFYGMVGIKVRKSATVRSR